MQILNIAGYKFIELNDHGDLREAYLQICNSLSLKGTILLSQEGLNVTLAGPIDPINEFIFYLKKDPRFADICFHQTYSENVPFRRLKIKIKKEIISLRHANTHTHSRAPSLSPEAFKQWLDEKRDITILDVRNAFEIDYGSFKSATHLPLLKFSDFPLYLPSIDEHKPIVMFCTGGIRCEKAAHYLLNQGLTNVYQLDGGILGYFAKIGNVHYQGECFVFDDRVAISPAASKKCHQHK